MKSTVEQKVLAIFRELAGERANQIEVAIPKAQQTIAKALERSNFRTISLKLKWGLYFDAWGAVVLVTLLRNPAGFLSAPAFPVGLLGAFPNSAHASIVIAWFAGLGVSVGGWLMYFILTVFF